MAGLDIIRISNEPVMAAKGHYYDMWYWMYGSNWEPKILVYNIGSHTFSTVSQTLNHMNDTYKHQVLAFSNTKKAYPKSLPRSRTHI
jgi:hypothetical protein